MSNPVNRRIFLGSALGAAAAAGFLGGASRTAAAETAAKPPVCVFSKHLQFLDYPALAKTCREIGVDGVDLTVRGGGHVEPARVDRDLPAAVEAVRTEGLDVPMITTSLNDGADADARPILEAASKLGIRYCRVGGLKYDADGEILPQLAAAAEKLGRLAALAAEFGISLGYHNHSGMLNIGAPVWDAHRIFEQVASPHLGANLDLGHALVEGAFGDWQITLRLIRSHVKMMAVKDFVWEKNRPRWVKLGEGILPGVEMLNIMRDGNFAGPVSMHFEYRVASNEAMIEEVRQATVVLRAWLQSAGYA